MNGLGGRPLPRAQDEAPTSSGMEPGAATLGSSTTLGSVAEAIGAAPPLSVDLDPAVSRMALGIPTVVPGSLLFLTARPSATTVADALRRGAVGFVAREQVRTTDGDDLPTIICENPRLAYIEVVERLRRRFDPKTIAVTGSVGKTTTKEMIRLVASEVYETLYSKANANVIGYIGAYVQQIAPSTQVYVQETGAARPGMIAEGSQILRPDAFVVTNIGLNHVGDYGDDLDALVRDKMSHDQWLSDGGKVFLNYDDPSLREAEVLHDIVSFGIDSADVDYRAQSIREVDGKITFEVVERHSGERERIALNTVGVHNVYNALAAFAVGRWLDIPPESISAGLLRYQGVGTRQNLTSVGGERVLVDCFNASEVAIGTTADTLATVRTTGGGKRVLVVADIDDKLGERTEEVHRRVGSALASKTQIDNVVLFGEHMKWAAQEAEMAGRPVFHTTDRDALNGHLAALIAPGDAVAFKGGQQMSLAATVDALYGTDFILEDNYELAKRSTAAEVGRMKFQIIRDVGAIFSGVAGEFADPRLRVPSGVSGVPVVMVGRRAAARLAIQELLVEEPVRTLSRGAFMECTSLESVFLPDSLRYIGRSAFFGCKSLRTLRFPNGVTHIEKWALRGCSSLEIVDVPPSVREIKPAVFAGCSSLREVRVAQGSYAARVLTKRGLGPKLKFTSSLEVGEKQ